jgi:hypothetical protein
LLRAWSFLQEAATHHEFDAGRLREGLFADLAVLLFFHLLLVELRAES